MAYQPGKCIHATKNEFKSMWFICFLFVLALLHASSCVVEGKKDDEGKANARVPAELVAKALNHVATASYASPDTAESIISSIQAGNVDQLYQVAKAMNSSPSSEDTKLASIQIFHALADGPSHHTLSMVQLGHTYSEADKSQALKYFVQAGEDGPHQASLYNAGRLFLEVEEPLEYDRALAYIRAAATLADDKGTAMYAKPQMTDTATKAYNDLSKALISSVQAGGLTFEQMMNLFSYASIDNNPKPGSKGDKLWNGAMEKTVKFINQGKNEADMSVLESVRNDLTKLLEVGKKELSALQMELIAAMLNETLRIIQAGDEL